LIGEVGEIVANELLSFKIENGVAGGVVEVWITH
jgi:hypothetical protein